jgi:hypothetical protein
MNQEIVVQDVRIVPQFHVLQFTVQSRFMSQESVVGDVIKTVDWSDVPHLNVRMRSSNQEIAVPLVRIAQE